NSKFSIALNAYPGILGSMERTNIDSVRLDPSMSFTAPVGFSIAWGWPKGHSLGLFIPVIDIGALTRLRLDNDKKTETLPEFSFKNIFAPGAYFSWGIINTPLSINAGAQFGPELKEIVPDG